MIHFFLLELLLAETPDICLLSLLVLVVVLMVVLMVVLVVVVFIFGPSDDISVFVVIDDC